MKSLILSLIIGLCLFLPSLTVAQTLQPDTFTDPSVSAEGTISEGFVPCSGATCSTCDFVVMANTIIKWLFGLAFIFFAVLAVKAGIGLVTSGGNPGAKSEAKSSFTNAFIGLFIFLAAWLLIDVLMRNLLAGGNGEITISNFGPWQQVKCGEDQVDPGVSAGYFDGDPEYVAGTTAPPPPASYGTVQPDSTADGRVRYQTAGIASQWSHASAPLQNMLNCIARTVPAGVGQISSISDSRITSGSKTWAQCRLGGCAHVANSRHYGESGRCGDRSYAVDYGDENNMNRICAAANTCGGAGSCSVHNGNHVHLSLPVQCN